MWKRVQTSHFFSFLRIAAGAVVVVVVVVTTFSGLFSSELFTGHSAVESSIEFKGKTKALPFLTILC